MSAIRACEGGRKLVNAGTNAVDLSEHSIVTILVVGGSSSAGSIAVQDGDTTSTSAAAAEDIIDPNTGQTATLSSFATNSLTVLSYIGYKRYLKVTGTNCSAYVLLECPKRTN